MTRHEATLDAREERGHAAMLALVEHVPEAVARHDMAGRIVYCNPAWQRLMGCTPAAMGRRVDELSPGHLASLHYQRVLEQVAARGEPAEFGFTIDGGEATRRDAQIRIVPETAADGAPVGLLAFGRDLTRQRELERALRLRTAELHDIVEHSSDYIARYDADCRRVYANLRLQALLGGDAEWILGKTPAEVPGGAGAALLMQALRDVFARGLPRDVRIRWRTDGGDVCHQVRVSPQFDGTGRVTHVLAVGREVGDGDRYRETAY